MINDNLKYNNNFQFDSYVNEIDIKNIDEIKILINNYYNNNNNNGNIFCENKNDILYEMYDKYLLSFERLKYHYCY